MNRPSIMSEFAGDPAMAEVSGHAGWKPVLMTLHALALSVSLFFSQPEPAPEQVAAAPAESAP